MELEELIGIIPGAFMISAGIVFCTDSIKETAKNFSYKRWEYKTYLNNPQKELFPELAPQKPSLIKTYFETVKGIFKK